MKLEKILSRVNSLEKNSFLKIIDNIISNEPENKKEINKILSENINNLKEVDNIIISLVFDLVKKEYTEIIKEEFVETTSQIDILVDIIIRDGNCIMKDDWFYKLYEKEITKISQKTAQLETLLSDSNTEIDSLRKRDYIIYKKCVFTAYFNDLENNRDPKITAEELSILLTLANELQLSQEEIKTINYLVIPPKKLKLEDLINELKTIGVIFYSKKNREIYVADEMVRVLRGLRNKRIADKFYRRFLNLLREPQINYVCRKHNIDIKLPYQEKIKAIINEGISFYNLLTDELHKEGTNLTDKKKFINEIWEKGLDNTGTLKGITLDEKIDNLILYFNNIEKDEKVGISNEGYDKLLNDLNDTFKELNQKIRLEFELQDEFVLKGDYLLDFNIKPRDILDQLSKEEMIVFVDKYEIKKRGNYAINILDAYKDAENLFIENYENIGYRNLNELKNNGILIKESELGIKFEDITKSIFLKLGFNVDEKLKKQLSNSKNKIDILLNLGDDGVIIIECKTVKDAGYNKFSAVTRQMKSYIDIVNQNGFTVLKSLLVAPSFSDDFINECDLDFELNLSLITASSLVSILEAFKESKHKQFPYQLLMKDVLIKEDRIIKAILK